MSLTCTSRKNWELDNQCAMWESGSEFYSSICAPTNTPASNQKNLFFSVIFVLFARQTSKSSSVFSQLSSSLAYSLNHTTNKKKSVYRQLKNNKNKYTHICFYYFILFHIHKRPLIIWANRGTHIFPQQCYHKVPSEYNFKRSFFFHFSTHKKLFFSYFHSCSLSAAGSV